MFAESYNHDSAESAIKEWESAMEALFEYVSECMSKHIKTRQKERTPELQHKVEESQLRQSSSKRIKTEHLEALFDYV